MRFKTMLKITREHSYFELAEKQIEAIHNKYYRLAHLYNCCTWIKLFESRDGPEKIRAWKYALTSYRFSQAP